MNTSDESLKPGNTSTTSTPRWAAAARTSMKAGSGTKYAMVMCMDFCALSKADISVR
ncbi:hypothetical protein D3C85_1631050 [compost metagenome]